MLRPGSLLEGKYRILREIGHGGMSTVYLALNERANKTWAVKEIRRGEEAQKCLFHSRILAETEMLKRLHHPCLPEIVDVIDDRESLLIVMDYVQGRDLQRILEEHKEEDPEANGAMDPEAVRAWSIQICDLLEYLHSRTPPVIYRDLKPSNIMLQDDPSGREPYGRICLIDFGAARELKTDGEADTISLGTRGYAAPEQFGGKGESDARTDIFNLGATIYHLLTGYSPAQTDYRFLPLGDLRAELRGSGMEMIVAKCCEAAREDRYQSAAELKKDLENEPCMSRSAVRIYRIRMRCFLSAVAAALLAAVSAGLFGCACLRTRNAAYETCIQRAVSSESVEEGREFWMRAVCLYPGRPEAYQSLLNTLEEDDLVTIRERKTLEDCLTTVASGNSRPNMEILRRASRAAFDRIMYRTGVDYFFFYESGDGYHYAAQKLGSVKNTADLEEGREASICGSLKLIADFRMKQRKNTAPESWITDSNAEEVWKSLLEYTSCPAEAVQKCGTPRISIVMYRELSRLILTHAAVFRDAGIGADQMKTALSTAEDFVEIYREEYYEPAHGNRLLLETEQAVDAAKFRLKQLSQGTEKQ